MHHPVVQFATAKYTLAPKVQFLPLALVIAETLHVMPFIFIAWAATKIKRSG